MWRLLLGLASSALACCLTGSIAPARSVDACRNQILARGNLDRDRAVETLVLRDVCRSGRPPLFVELRLQDAGLCTIGTTIFRVRFHYANDLVAARIFEADNRRDGRREAFVALGGERTSAGPGAAVVHLVHPSSRTCPVVRYLFRYLEPTDVISFDARLGDFASYPGLEIRLVEQMAMAERIRFFRFAPKRGYYVPLEPSPGAGELSR